MQDEKTSEQQKKERKWVDIWCYSRQCAHQIFSDSSGWWRWCPGCCIHVAYMLCKIVLKLEPWQTLQKFVEPFRSLCKWKAASIFIMIIIVLIYMESGDDIWGWFRHVLRTKTEIGAMNPPSRVAFLIGQPKRRAGMGVWGWWDGEMVRWVKVSSRPIIGTAMGGNLRVFDQSEEPQPGLWDIANGNPTICYSPSSCFCSCLLLVMDLRIQNYLHPLNMKATSMTKIKWCAK